jgi:hypothetical protein
LPIREDGPARSLLRLRQRGAQAGPDQLCDLHRVEGGTLAQVVVADEEDEALAGRRRLVGADATHVARVVAGRLQRRGHLFEDDAGGGCQDLARTLGSDVLCELCVDRQRVAGEDRHAHTGARDQEVRQLEDLAALVAELLLLVGLVVAVVDEVAREGITSNAMGATYFSGCGKSTAEPS